MPNNTDISIVILTKNFEKNIGRCLSICFSQKCENSFEVIVIDSGSTDNTIEIVRKFPAKLVTIKSEEFHHSKTRNLGASLSSGDVLVYIGGDADPVDDNWLENLTKHLKDDRVVAVYGGQTPKEDCNSSNEFRLRWNYPSYPMLKNSSTIKKYGHKIYFFSTVNCAIKKDVWQKYKFNEDIDIFEDTVFAKEVIDSGYSIYYEPNAVVVHSHNLKSKDIFKRYRNMGEIQSQFNFTNDLGKSYNREGRQYVVAGVSYILKKSGVFGAMYFVIFTSAAFLGLLLGKFSGSKKGRIFKK